MNRCIAALTIGIGLMAHSSAFAEILDFGPKNDAPMEECLVAADDGLELSEEKADGGVGERRFLVKGFGLAASWRVYEIFMIRGGKDMSLKCTYRSLTKRTT